MTRSNAHRWRGYGLALLAAACWASGGLMAKWLFTPVSSSAAAWPVPPMGIVITPTELSAGRALAAFAILATVLTLGRSRLMMVTKTDLPFLALFGVVGLAGVHYTYFKTISLTNVATAILLEYLAPVIVLAVGVLFMGHRFTWSLPVGVALSIAGCALVVGAIGGQGLVVSPAGVAWGLLSAIFFAGYSLMGSVGVERLSPWTMLLYGLGFAALFWLIVLGPGPVFSLFARPRIGAALVVMAVVSTIVPFLAFLVALRHIAPTNATVTSTVEPVIAGAGAFLLFGESLTTMQLMGGGLVLAAIMVVQMPQAGGAYALPPAD